MDWKKVADRVIKTGIGAFGRSVTYYPQHHECVEIRAIFDQAYIAVNPDTGVPVDSQVPVLHVRLADLPFTPGQGDRVGICGAMYRVISNQPDGQGAAMLVLHKL